MNIDKIKPIPKYIEKLIKKEDTHAIQNAQVRFYSYLTKMDKQLAKVTVAVKIYKNNWYCKQVSIHFIHNKKCLTKDTIYHYIAGYKVGWHDQGHYRTRKWYEDNIWYWAEDKYYDMFAPIVNLDYLQKFPEYKYCGITSKYDCYVLQYLRLYEKYPQMEYLTKLGLRDLATKKQILELINKSKEFMKWIIRNREKLQKGRYHVDVIIKAFKQNESLDKLQNKKKIILEYSRYDSYKKLKEKLSKKDMEKLLNYIQQKNTNLSSYNDYYTACEKLNVDLTQDKNLFPHDFKRWHDIRTDEYETLKAEEDKKRRKELYEKFNSIALKYSTLQHNKKQAYITVIAQSPADLKREGKLLNHCVGSMGYDQKFIREESLIFFVRNKDNPDMPFVTLEYSLKNKRVLQCYGDHDSKPNENVLSYVNNVWLPYTKRQLKRIGA